jgi:drug/metabolite transporter (DMT)-like permease
MQRSSPILTFLLCSAAAATFSSKGVLAKLAYAAGGQPIEVLTLRMLMSLPAFLLIAWWSGRGQSRIPRADAVRIVGLGCIGYYLASVLDFSGLAHISAGLERLVLFTYPALTVVFTGIISRRRPTPGIVAAVCVTYAGLAVAYGGEAAHPQAGSVMTGTLLVLGSAVSYALFLTLSSGLIARHGGIRVLSWSMIISSVLVFTHHSIASGITEWSAPKPRVVAICVIIAVMGTIIPTLLSGMALRRAGPERFAIIGTLGPITTVVMAWFLLNERPGLSTALGGALVIVGSLTAARLRKAQTFAPPSHPEVQVAAQR